MLKFSQHTNWISFLFATYGVPALLMIAVLPVSHKQGCACPRPGIPLVHAPLQTVYCAACKFNTSIPLAAAEPAATDTGYSGPHVGATVAHDAPATRRHEASHRAHSPPFAVNDLVASTRLWV